MEYKVKVLPAEQLLPQLLGLLEETEMVPLVISGNSMSPFLVHSRDTVYLTKVKRPLKRGDMILYRRDSGRYILHRICRVEKDSYCLVGDAQTIVEPGIRWDQILAVVSQVRRKGKLQKPGCFWWEFFEKVWIRMIPFRRMFVSAYTWITGTGSVQPDPSIGE